MRSKNLTPESHWWLWVILGCYASVWSFVGVWVRWEELRDAEMYEISPPKEYPFILALMYGFTLYAVALAGMALLSFLSESLQTPPWWVTVSAVGLYYVGFVILLIYVWCTIRDDESALVDDLH